MTVLLVADILLSASIRLRSAATVIGNYLEISERIVRQWRYDFYRSYGKDLQEN